MGSGVIYYEYEKREKFEDYDMKADDELGTFKIRRFHFDNESFVHPLHSVRFDPDRPYEIPIEALMEIGGMDPSEKEESSEEDPEMEEEYSEEVGDLEDRVPATPSLPMDIDVEEDFQRYVEELGCAPEPSPLRSSQASVPDELVEAADRQSASHYGSSYDLSGVW
ncbi:hypothetical protein PIB30_016096 [Stylosanthes scabra]|uniref:Uncharacterized protein n=1 Tax=Stylosanthes scabra TaxID=79078 RepID=A0ABU6Q858_9FABA|nr:hypothetical protein [Stylosanthes scabra]